MTTEQVQQLPPSEAEAMMVRAKAIREQRQAKGEWGGSVRPHVEYQRRPLAWITEKLGVPEHTIRWSMNPGYAAHQWDGDRDPMVGILEALADGSSVGVESGTGTGKTFTAACVVFWFLACFENALVITSAPKEENLLTQIWKEIGQLMPAFRRHFPTAEGPGSSGKLRMLGGDKNRKDEKEGWTAMAFVAGVRAEEDTAQRAAGFHRKHMLIITEDTPGIDPAIMAAFGQTRTDDHNIHLALGNPDHRNDALHRFCFDEREQVRSGVKHFRVSALDHPNVVSGQSIIGGAIGRRRLAERTQECGGVGARLYESRVRGVCPSESEEALIRYEWCLAAAKRYDDPSYRLGRSALGVDPSNSERGDPAAISRWQGACCTEVVSKPCPDAGILGEEIVAEAQDPRNPVRPENVGVDDVGVGASTVNAAKRLRFRVKRLGGSTKATPGIDDTDRWSQVEVQEDGSVRPVGPRIVQAERYKNLRSKMGWIFREDMRLGRIALPLDPELFQDLCTLQYTTVNGVITIESKDDVKSRLPGRRSPNKGDSCIYGNYVRDRSLPMPEKREIERNTRNEDYGLERMLRRADERSKAERKRIQNIFSRRSRDKKR